MNTVQPTPKKSKLSIIAIVLLLVSAGVTGYFQYQQSQLKPQKELLEKSIKNIDDQLNGSSQNQTSQHMVALVDKTKSRIAWSKIMSSITNFETPSLSFQQFSSTNTKPYQVEVSGKAASVESIQLLLKRLQESSKVETPFIHSLQTQKDDNNNLMFTLTFTLK
ncbi:hypothetical protein CSB37_02125 [bacterium DOLZORAL124_38_8]|nr:MAG: hypothetical protein CSB37_02125 [bacterium DOLZORAL124_38_8]